MPHTLNVRSFIRKHCLRYFDCLLLCGSDRRSSFGMLLPHRIVAFQLASLYVNVSFSRFTHGLTIPLILILASQTRSGFDRCLTAAIRPGVSSFCQNERVTEKNRILALAY